MSKNAKSELLTQRAQLMEDWGKILAITERELTPEEAQTVADLQAKVDDIDARVKALEGEEETETEEPAQNSRPIGELRAEHAKRIQTRKVNPAPGFVRDYNDRQAARDSALAFRGWFMGKEATAEQRAAAHRAGLNLDGPMLISHPQSEEFRAQSTSGTAGGYMVPQGFLAELEKRRLAFNPLRDVARVIRTESGNPMPMPTMDDTANLGALTAENTATNATDYALAQVTFGAYTYKSLVSCSLELLQDSGLDIGNIVGELLGERLGRAEAAAFAIGTGTGQPQGIVTGASAGKTATSATAIAFADLLDLRNSLDAAYQPTASFMFHQSVWNTILKIQDGTQNGIIQRITGVGAPIELMLFGHKVIINNNLESSVATGKITGLFGDFSKFYIREAGPIVLRRSDEFQFNANAAVFMATERVDSRVVQTNAIKKLTQA